VSEAEQLIIFLKAPRVGTVKTRLAQAIGAEPACAAYRELAERVLGVAGRFGPAELRFSPDDALNEIVPWLRRNWTAQPQGDGDLGARMHRAFSDAFARGTERVVIIGSDCPEIQTSDLRSAFRELKTHDLVVGPAIDGGYWLIGLRAPQPEIFRDIAWSSEQVLGQTLQRAKALGLKMQLLRILTDIDTEDDWRQYLASKSS
jgi:rSAM/selenodomain-associated transferase 1